MSDQFEAIRKALAAGPTPGSWRFIIDAGFDNEAEVPAEFRPNAFSGNPAIIGSDGTEVAGCDEYYIFSGPKDVAYLLACDPDTIRALLAEYDRMREARAVFVDGWYLPADALNEPMRASLAALVAHATRARWTNAIVRKDGKETTYEADWIKSLVPFGSAHADAAIEAAHGIGGITKETK